MLCSGIGTGAFGAHGLQKVLEAKKLQVWNTSVHYHLVSGCALLALGAYRHTTSVRGVGPFSAAGLVTMGTGLFCGSLYALALGAPSKLGIVTPIGGLLMMAGWGGAFVGFLQQN